ncbi:MULTISPECIES: hypothetical protein [unclassified Streptomyces]|uniref:hypothetical protein n=1 Tax=unclassified Streptomyces TaxID=2593676 RepID=UPI002DDC6773|nr:MULTISPECIES: hypothetical protein [unclassified Streptomyces]WSA90873.1 hypothetical protein OIE63_04455 [Streptomyces sp. NBC_01795]WSB75195.1 hypothetical protein OHB04_04985 [Streptomyces sp. NBC_01775]WSS16521.1 hypothetical protein OG533_34915 [Streptomyces sp. NBC_01186]WSS45338.1 hypothetical protein OG220_35595 [Streptomyces sp. NBC_01187]
MADSVKNAKANGTTGGAASKARSAVVDAGDGAKRAAKAAEAVGTKATAGLALVKARKKIAAGAGGSLIALFAGAFALGRKSASRKTGPLTRLTHGRI